MTIIDEIEKAIAVHCAWADSLKAAIETGVSELSVAEAMRDDACAFGHWLHGDTIPESARAVHGYDNARQIHAEFHHYAAGVLELALSGKREEAIAHMDNTSLYTTTSVMLTLTLRAWQIDIDGLSEAPV